MDRLPVEILSDIFLWAILPPENSELKLARVRAESVNIPFRISQVCRIWREIALNDGHLWSHIVLGSWAVGAKISKPIFDVCFARSKEAPLNYRILLAFPFQVHSEADDIANRLVSQQHRWRDIHFSLYNRWIWGDNHKFHLTNMPLLTSLSLDFSPLRITIDLGQSPQLRRVNFRGDFDLLPIQGPLQLLTLPSKLNFAGECLKKSAIVSCLNFLEAAIFLEELIIYFNGISSPPTSPSNDGCQFVSGLRRLKLNNYARGILDNVTLPSLEVFSFGSIIVSGEDRSEIIFSDDGFDFLVDFFRRSRPPLTYLSLVGASAHADIIIPILRMLPTLRHLELHNAYPSARLYDELTITSHTVCPAIESLQITALQQAVCADALVTMLKSRAQIMDSFKTVRFYSASSYDKPIETAHLGEYDDSVLEELSLGFIVGETPKEFASTKFFYE